jgi:hypothetical protein
MAIEKFEKINGTCQLINVTETWVAQGQPYPYWISESLLAYKNLVNVVLLSSAA